MKQAMSLFCTLPLAIAASGWALPSVAASADRDIPETLEVKAKGKKRSVDDSLDKSAISDEDVFRGIELGLHQAYSLGLGDLDSTLFSPWNGLEDSKLLAKAFGDPITIATIQASLPSKSVLVEFFQYTPTVRGVASFDTDTNRAQYAACLITSERIDCANLGPAKTIHELAHEFRKSLALEREDIVDRARAMYDVIMRPVVGKLGRQKRQLFVAPDGELDLVPFGALHDGRRYLIESYALDYIGTGSDLLRLSDSDRVAEGPIVVVANPTRANLTGTEDVAAILKTLFDDVHVLTGDNATEAQLRRIARPRLLHIGVHGMPENHPSDETLRQGTSLILADAEKTLIEKRSEDGVLMAHEIERWDLEGTELVTLSACESGLGVVVPGEGVFGLRRALEIAGVQTQIVGLWSISDNATAVLWDAYYTRLAEGEGRGEAMQNAQLEMLRSRNHSHPFYWAAFVTSGDWRPLSRPREPKPPPLSQCGCRASVGRPDVDGHVGLLLPLLLASRRRKARCGKEERGT